MSTALSDSERYRTYCLDSAALIGAALRGDSSMFAVSLMTYTDIDELRELLAATIGVAAQLLRGASETSGVPPESFLGAAVGTIRAMP